MECGKLTAKLRDAVPVCFIENGKEIKKLPYQDFEFSVPVTGAITFKIMFEEGILPKVWPEARTRKSRKAKPDVVQNLLFCNETFRIQRCHERLVCRAGYRAGLTDRAAGL